MSNAVDYEYSRPWPIFATAFKNTDITVNGAPHAAIAVGSFLKELENRIDIIAVPKQTPPVKNGLIKAAKPTPICSFAHPYPAAKILWSPKPESNLLATIGFNMRLYSFDETEGAVKAEFGFRTVNALLALDWHGDSGEHGLIVTGGIGGANGGGNNLVVWDIDRTQSLATSGANNAADGIEDGGEDLSRTATMAGVRGLSQEGEAKIFQLPVEHELAMADIFDVAFIPGTNGEEVLCACREGKHLDQVSSVWRVHVRAERFHESTKIWESASESINSLRWCPATGASSPHKLFGILSTGHDAETKSPAHRVSLHLSSGRHSLHGDVDLVRLPENSRTLAWFPEAEGRDEGQRPLFRCCTVGESAQAGHLTIWTIEEDSQPRKEFTLSLSGLKDGDYIGNLQWSRHESPIKADLVALAFTYKLQIVNLRTCC